MNKQLSSYFIALCLLFLSQFVMAEEQIAISEPQAKTIHQELRKLKDTLEKAMNENDVATILANVDEKVIFSTMNADVVTGRENLGAYYKKMMQGPNKVIDSITSTFVADDLSILHEDDIAIAHGHSDSSYKLAIGKTLDIKGVWTSTLIHRNGAWKIASFHYSVDMFDNPILKAQNKMLWIVGAGGALLALLAFFLGRRRK